MAELLRCYRHPDRETGVSCSECGRGICPDCMVFAPVGIRCPDHSGQPKGAARVVQNVQRTTSRNPSIVTMTLIGINVGIYLLQLAGGASVNANSGWIFEHGALYGPLVAQGDWYRLLSAAFLHYGPFHLGLNMLALWWIGRPLESYLGSVRFLLLYLVSGLAGSAGALLVTPTGVTVGASGAILRNPRRRDRARAPGNLRARRRRAAPADREPRVQLCRAGHLDRGPSRWRGRRCPLHPRALAASAREALRTGASTCCQSSASWRSAPSASRSRTGRCAATPSAR